MVWLVMVSDGLGVTCVSECESEKMRHEKKKFEPNTQKHTNTQNDVEDGRQGNRTDTRRKNRPFQSKCKRGLDGKDGGKRTQTQTTGT
mgnify:CR=1 FL=1